MITKSSYGSFQGSLFHYYKGESKSIILRNGIYTVCSSLSQSYNENIAFFFYLCIIFCRVLQGPFKSLVAFESISDTNSVPESSLPSKKCILIGGLSGTF